MPRKPRVKSESQFYHVMFKGLNSQLLFMDDEDKAAWVSRMQMYLGDFDNNTQLHAYCIMDNHIHMLIRDCDDSLDRVMKKLGVSYVLYYNGKYGRTGHLFNDRFKSEPVETDEYYLTVQRYIHQNPEKAGIDATSEYEWSSYKIFTSGKGSFVHTDLLLSMLGGVDEFIQYMEMENSDLCLDIDEYLGDSEALRIIMELVGGFGNIEDVKTLRRDEQSQLCAMCKKAGLRKNQVLRITGIGRYALELGWK